jgi:hypothetical protein
MRLGEAHDKDQIFVVCFIWRRTAKARLRHFRRPAISTFILPCAVFNAWQRAFAVRATKSARQRSFAVQKSTVQPLSCVFEKNARQRLCHAFGKPWVSCSDFYLMPAVASCRSRKRIGRRRQRLVDAWDVGSSFPLCECRRDSQRLVRRAACWWHARTQCCKCLRYMP